MERSNWTAAVNTWDLMLLRKPINQKVKIKDRHYLLLAFTLATQCGIANAASRVYICCDTVSSPPMRGSTLDINTASHLLLLRPSHFTSSLSYLRTIPLFQFSVSSQSNMMLINILALTLACVSYAAESSGIDAGDCPVKGIEGAYSYDPTSDNGPADWGKISGFETCSSGNRQSPVDFPVGVSYAPLADGPKPMIMAANMTPGSGSYNWALNCPTGSDCGSTMFGGKLFRLINMHFHSPSEHTLGGEQYPLELHMVHIADDGSLAVIATMFKYPDSDYPAQVAEGINVPYGTNGLVKQALNGLDNNRDSIMVHLGSVINAKKGYCVYVGSLTTPPCTEGVTFLMSQNIVSVTERQVAKYRLSAGVGYDGNNRPLQALNERSITCYVK